MTKKRLTVFAHPDDETFTSGGTIAKLAQQGVEIVSLVATKGEAGQRSGYETDSRSTGEIREKELKEAALVLGIHQLIFLGYQDGTWATADYSTLKKKIRREIDSIQPQVILTFEPNGISAHPDHQTISKVTTDLFSELTTKGYLKRLFYTCFTESTAKQFKVMGMDGKPFRGIPDEKVDIWSDISDNFDVKVRAMHCHRSQINDVERILALTQDCLNREAFLQAYPDNQKYSSFFEEL